MPTRKRFLNVGFVGIITPVKRILFSHLVNVLARSAISTLIALKAGLKLRSNKSRALLSHPIIGKPLNVKYAKKPILCRSELMEKLITLLSMKSLMVIF